MTRFAATALLAVSMLFGEDPERIPSVSELRTDYAWALDALPDNAAANLCHYRLILESDLSIGEELRRKIDDAGIYFMRARRYNREISEFFLDEQQMENLERRKEIAAVIGRLWIQNTMVKNMIIEIEDALPFPEKSFKNWEKRIDDDKVKPK